MSPEVLQLRGAVQRLRDRCSIGSSSSRSSRPAVRRRRRFRMMIASLPYRAARHLFSRWCARSPSSGSHPDPHSTWRTTAGSAGGRRGPSHPWSPTPAPTGTGSSASPSTAPRSLYRREGRRPEPHRHRPAGRELPYRWSSSKATSSTANGRPVLVFTAPNRLIAASAGPGQPMWAVRCRSLVPQSPSSSRGRPRGQRAARPRPWPTVGVSGASISHGERQTGVLGRAPRLDSNQ